MAFPASISSVSTIAFIANDRGLSVTALLGDGLPTPSGGTGVWESVIRPGRRPLTVWRSVDALRLAVPVIFDGFTTDRSVEGELRTLRALAGASEAEPPVLTISGGIAHNYAEHRWVIESVEWGEGARRRSDGARIRQAATVTLLKFTEDDRMERIRRPKGKPQYRFVDVHKGDTYAKLAKRHLGTSKLGRRLARLNGARSADVVVKLKKVRLPTPDALKDWKRDLKRGG